MPIHTRLVLCPAFCVLLWPSLLEAETPANRQDGRLTLENDRLRAEIDPSRGAALISFVMKPDGRELLSGPSFVDSNILPGRRVQSLADLSFQVAKHDAQTAEEGAVCELTAALPKEAPISFWGETVGYAYNAIVYSPPAVLEWPRPYENLRLTKCYRLRRNVDALSVEYEVTNTGDRALELCLGTTLALAGSAMSVATRDGAAHFKLPVENFGQMPLLQFGLQPWLYDVPAAWVAMVGDGGVGAVGWSDPRHVSFLQPDLKAGTLTVGRTRVRLEPGGTFRTTAGLMPVAGLMRVDGAEGEVAAEFRVQPPEADGAPKLIRQDYTGGEEAPVGLLDVSLKPEGPAEKAGLEAGQEVGGEEDLLLAARKVSQKDIAVEFEGKDNVLKKVDVGYKGRPIRVELLLYSTRPHSFSVAFRTRLNPHGEWQDLETQKAEPRSRQPAALATTLTPQRAGTYIVEATLSEDGREVARFAHPVIAGRPTGFFLPEAPAKEGDINKEFYYWHVGGKPEWPYEYGWKPSAEYETPHFDYASPLAGGPVRALFITPFPRSREVIELAQRMDLDWDYVVIGGPGGGSRATIDEIDYCRAALNKRHEVIVLPHYAGTRLPVDISEEIARQVREGGVGLVFSLPGRLFGSFAQFNENARRDEGCPEPFRRVEIGKGRVVFRDGQGGDLITNWLCEHGREMIEDRIGDFARMFLWAARGDPPVSVQSVFPGSLAQISREKLLGQPLRVRLSNRTDRPVSGRLRVVAQQDLRRDYGFYPTAEMLRAHRPVPEWEERGRSEAPFDLPAGGESQADLPAPSVPAGQFRFFVYALDASGANLTWERFPLVVRAEADIAAVEVLSGARERQQFQFDKTGYWGALFTAQPDATLELACKLVKAENMERMSLFAADPWGRVIGEAEQRLETGLAERSVRFSLPLKSCLHRVVVVCLRAYDASGCVSDRRLCGFIYPRPDHVPVYRFRAYAEESEMDRRLTGYDSRVGASPFMRAILHAWCGPSVEAWLGGPPTMLRVSVPGEKIEALPELSFLSALAQGDAPGGAALAGGDASAGPDAAQQAADDQTEGLGAREDDIGVSMLIEPGQEKGQEQPDALEEAIEAEKQEEKGPIDPKNGWVRIPCLNDPRLRRAFLDGIGDLYRSQSFFGPFHGGLGDEWYVTKVGVLQDKHNPWRRAFVPGADTNSCRCPHCLALFREYARNLFDGDLAALNQEWNTAFKAWEEVDRPIVNETVKDNRAPPEEKWAYVLDHRRFDDVRVGDLMKEIHGVVKGIDPQNRLGWGNVFKTSLWSGLDAYLMSRYCDNNQLNRDQIKWASFGSPTNSTWVGYQKKYSFIRENFTAWWSMIEGNTAVTYYGKSRYPMHRPDFSFFEGPKEMYRAMGEIREYGFDRLLVGHRQTDPVAVHYDPASIYVAQLEDWAENPGQFAGAMGCGGRSYNEFCHQVEGVYEGLVARRRLNHFATAYGQLEEGHFGRYGTPKLLLLPYTQCISERQADTLEKFVRDGGVLVGDVATGARNGHGRRLETGYLDHVFGVRRVKPKRPMRVRADAAGNRIPVQFGEALGGPFAFTFAAVGPGDVVADTAKPMAHYLLDGEREPAFLVNEFGKGKAFYLNFIPCGGEPVIEEEDPTTADRQRVGALADQRIHRVLDEIVRAAGLNPPVECNAPLFARYGEGPVSYPCLGVGYKGEPDSWRKPYQVRLREKQHVYDARRGAYLGFTDQFDARFSIEDKLFVLIYAAMPYKVEGIAIDLERQAVKPGGTLHFTAGLLPSEAQKHRHCLAVHVSDPEGKDMYWYQCVIETKEGVATGRVDFALNDRPGTWTLRLTDTATGTTAEKTFRVE